MIGKNRLLDYINYIILCKCNIIVYFHISNDTVFNTDPTFTLFFVFFVGDWPVVPANVYSKNIYNINGNKKFIPAGHMHKYKM